jgi:hypothetical protein
MRKMMIGSGSEWISEKILTWTVYLLQIKEDKFFGLARLYLGIGTPASSTEAYYQLDVLSILEDNRSLHIQYQCSFERVTRFKCPFVATLDTILMRGRSGV